MAVNCCMVPAAIDGFDGPMVIDVTVALETVAPVICVWPPKDAVMVALPTELAVARPLASIEIAAELELHETWLVTLADEPSL